MSRKIEPIGTDVSDPISAPPTAKARAVLAGARKVFLAQGFSAGSTDEIQREAGVSKSTVYAHYPTKEALFVAVVQAECEVFMDAVRSIPIRPGALPETLKALAVRYLEVVLSPAALALFRVTVADAPRFPQLARALYLAGPHVMTMRVAEHLAQAVEAGEIDLAEPGRDAAASLFVSMVRGEPHLEYLTHPEARPTQAQIEHWASLAVNTFLRAYGRAG
ncbi:TetR/AcrR family transcriptional regulator [Bordetella sp. BOR01]|nr:TetR/AcrR family transcriptional regulator [Bordetella sp. BOR01]